MSFPSSSNEAPWRSSSRTYSFPPINGLHEEVEECFQWLKATNAEDYARDYAVRELTRITKEKWPKVVVEVIGSFGTGLTLPTSDVDVVMFGAWDTSPLRTLANLLADCGFCDPWKTEVVDAARVKVPLIKLVHAKTQVKLDISFNHVDGLNSSELLSRFIGSYPLFPKIYLIVKQMLVRRNLNESFTGGVSSFSLALMVVFFFQRLEVKHYVPRTNLGVLLMEFFEYYAYEFDFKKYGIDVKLRRPVPKNYRAGCLYIVNPVRPNDQAAASTKLIDSVKDCFMSAFSTLSAEMKKSERGDGQSRFCGILHKLVKVDDVTIQWRSKVKKMYENRELGSAFSRSVSSSRQRSLDDVRRDLPSVSYGTSLPATSKWKPIVL